MADDATVGVARDVRPPLPRVGIWVAGSNVLCLQALKFLLGTQFVGL